MGYDIYINLLRENLDDYRFKHSLCVADEAKRLALKYGCDAEDAYLAGLLHDITKCFSNDEHLKIFSRFDIIPNNVEKASNKLWHAISGSLYVKHILKVVNDEIISAIRYHTTAKDNMTLLEKVLYLADYTSADRNYADVDVMRRLVNENLDDALLYALKYTINELVNEQRAVHPDTISAYNETVIKINNRGEIK